MTTTTTKSFKQPQHVALPVAVPGMMAAPCSLVRTKLLLYAALGFALGVAVALSVTGSSSSSSSSSSYTVAVLRGGGGALDIFFPQAVQPSHAAAATTEAENLSSDGVVHVLRNNPPPPPADAGGRDDADAPPPPPPVAGVVQHAVQPGPPQATPTTTPTPATILPSPSNHPSQQRQPVADDDIVVGVAAAPPPPAPIISRGSGSFVVLSDEDLLARAASSPRTVPPAGAAPKVAFLFLTRWDLPMAPLWEKFFEGHAGLYTVYVHTDPAFDGAEPTEGSAFFRRRIPSKEVKWGHISMVEAERRLLAHALLDDPANARFLLLSESHVPLFDLPTVHSYVVNSADVFLESYDLPGPTGRGRYHRGMRPVVAAGQWRKGSQWFEMDRALAVDVVADQLYFPVFKRFCKHNCYADEHYLPTFLHIQRPAARANRSLTWVDWSHGGPHPARFTRMEVTVDFLRWLRGGSTCTYNGETTNVCFLFARKFLPNSLTRFMRFAPKVLGFGR